METFEIGEHVICSATVKDEDGNLQNAATSMSIEIFKTAPSYEASLTLTVMTNDGTGLYHYDVTTTSLLEGDYKIVYTAVDGTRTTKQTDTFKLVTY